MNLKKYEKIAKKIYNDNKKRIKDIIIFGSAMKGKEEYNDIDVLLIFFDKVDKKIEKEFKTKLNESKLDINSVTLKEFKSDGFVAKEGIYLEGYSLVKSQKINKELGFISYALVKYDLKKIKGSKRTQFYYALYGRNDNIGFLEKNKAIKYSDNMILIDYSSVEKTKQFLDHWNIEYQIIPMLIPKRLKNILKY